MHNVTQLDISGVPVFAGCYTDDGAKSLKASASSRLHTVPLDVTKEESVQKAHRYVMDNLPKDGTGTYLFWFIFVLPWV